MGEVLLYDVMLDPIKYKSKSIAYKNVGAIKNRILNHHKKLSILEIADYIISGHSIIFGHAEYPKIKSIENKSIGANSSHWKKQQVFAIDIDDNLSIEQAKAICKRAGLEPSIIHTTSNHSEKHNRFRLIFVLDQTVETLKEHRNVINSLFNLFLDKDNNCLVDTKCSDPCRLFFSGKEIVELSPGIVLEKSKLLNRHCIQIVNKSSYTQNMKATGTNKKNIKQEYPINNELIESIKNLSEKDYFKAAKNRVTEFKIDNIQAGSDSEGCQANSEKVTYSFFTKDIFSAFTDEASQPVLKPISKGYYEFTRKIPLDAFLDLPLNKGFRCILPKHDDHNPSAKIYIDNNGNYRYYCFGCQNSGMDIFDLVTAISERPHYEVKNFINKIFNIQNETPWQAEQIKQAAEYQTYLLSRNFKERYNKLYKNLTNYTGKAFGLLNLFLTLSRLYILDKNKTKDNRFIFYISTKLLTRHANEIGLNLSLTKTHKLIKQLVRLGLINCLNKDEIPVRIKQLLETRKMIAKQKYRISVYTIPSHFINALTNAEKILEEKKKKGIRERNYSKKIEVNANGIEHARKIFVQDKFTDKSDKKFNNFYIKYLNIAKVLFLKQGWLTEKSILNQMFGYNKTIKNKYADQSLPKLLKELNLEIVHFSKKIQDKHKIDNLNKKLKYGGSRILILKSEVN